MLTSFLLLASCTGTVPEAPYSKETDPTITRSTDTDTADADTDTDTDTAPDTSEDSGTDTSTDSGGDTAELTLYDQLGGAAAVHAVITSFLGNVVGDAEINWMFADTDTAVLQTRLEELVCSATGGGCTYSGGTMHDVHAGMAITEAQWNALIGDFIKAYDDNSVPYTHGTFDGGLPADTLALALVGMHDDIVTDSDGSAVLFNQLGGHAAVQAVIDLFLTKVVADARINSFFVSTDAAVLDARLVEQVCSATGGYCVYHGKTMLEAHTGMNITDDDFNALVEDLVAALDDLGVPHTGTDPADSLLAALAGMHDDIVGH